MKNKLLILNLGVDSENTSLAFTQKWINELSLNYLKVDVITLKVGKKYKLNENVSLHYVNKNDSSYSKIHQLKMLNKITKELIKNNQYSHCFAHMAPLQHLIAKFYLSQKNIKSTLWFTHAGPKFGIKWLILFLSSVLANNIVTASKYSFPFKFKKIQVIGHGIDFDNFYNVKLNFSNKNILILSRISKSKNIENSLDNIVKCKNFEKFKVDIIGGTLNIQDEEYLEYLIKKFKKFNNIKFLGKKNHGELPDLLKKYDININNAKKGFFDKAVLETAASGIINFYKSNDFDFLYDEEFNKLLKFKEDNLFQKIDEIQEIEKQKVLDNINHAQSKSKNHSIKNVVSNLIKVFN